MMATSRELLPVKTPFHERTAALNQTTWWYGWNGYLVPDVYQDPLVELQAIRQAAVVVDMSALPKFEISGREALRLVNLLITRDASQMEVGQIYYTPLCDEAGNLVTEGLVFRHASDLFRLSLDNCYGWFLAHAAGLDVEVRDVTDDFGLLALQGPRSQQVLEAAMGQSRASLPFSRLRQVELAGKAVSLARQGFTGELGFEIWVKRKDALPVWDAVMVAGEPYGLCPAGEYAIDIARVEAGLFLISADYTGAGPDRRCADVVVDDNNIASPFEFGLERFVDFRKPEFIGRQELLDQKNRGFARQLVGLELDWREIASAYLQAGLPPDVSPRVRWDALVVLKDGRKIGRATSLTWSPTLSKLIGFGCLEHRYCTPGCGLHVRWPISGSFVEIPACVTRLPFLKRRRTAAAS
jgi:glycine cleavage system T protein (aminomethyltransferase)